MSILSCSSDPDGNARARLTAHTVRRLEQNDRRRPRTASVRMLREALGLDDAAAPVTDADLTSLHVAPSGRVIT
ncbi:hypothetical protein ACNTMW_28895 [Planosporangium sp. 12N6]|uniref:hypothetical protein n=1 Tax=Planosporangium spinosum TaxID=3402278 RepID=UPI003CF0595F